MGRDRRHIVRTETGGTFKDSRELRASPVTFLGVVKVRNPDWRPLDALLADRPRCVAMLKNYFGPLTLTGQQGYTGSRFELLSGGGDHPAVADRFVCDDLVAVSLLSVNVPPRAALYLVDDPSGNLGVNLEAIPTNVELVDAEDPHLAAAERLWHEIRTLDAVGRTKTSKLLARKRPRLAPVQDTITMAALGKPTMFTKPYARSSVPACIPSLLNSAENRLFHPRSPCSEASTC
ncbi:Uncharacterised protein [Mycobacteroides abscessus subsp. bolletii]|uniref:Uncharacterized protein n=1 Tax=Mycobacteroides abscessus subsp. bolletii TaxID=319705 RepID=A0A9Q7SCV5_9MYCO|nr:Uncharacterised protein [Mycobacteroides abscessus subsp. bolletii]SHV22117.1 Uncharacterised protein [Mycobacteroides abscessus subsp. bolletii]SHX20968.1 Uncharacterised protein [Mycobacteroides abscessus subsp. bolletii]SKL38090.1 Uncharacterised protein [Mycobacteroides abscessus subsp. bolletii]SKM62962.1 Uncharacterised protein [Mycobacteroides abscessus subsp. bolletii]